MKGWWPSSTKSSTRSKYSWSKVPARQSWYSGPDSWTPGGSDATSARSRLRYWTSISTHTWPTRTPARRPRRSWPESVESQCPRYCIQISLALIIIWFFKFMFFSFQNLSELFVIIFQRLFFYKTPRFVLVRFPVTLLR